MFHAEFLFILCSSFPFGNDDGFCYLKFSAMVSCVFMMLHILYLPKDFECIIPQPTEIGASMTTGDAGNGYLASTTQLTYALSGRQPSLSSFQWDPESYTNTAFTESPAV